MLNPHDIELDLYFNVFSFQQSQVIKRCMLMNVYFIQVVVIVTIREMGQILQCFPCIFNSIELLVAVI